MKTINIMFSRIIVDIHGKTHLLNTYYIESLERLQHDELTIIKMISGQQIFVKSDLNAMELFFNPEKTTI